MALDETHSLNKIEEKGGLLGEVYKEVRGKGKLLLI
jgi:hypothetical protein